MRTRKKRIFGSKERLRLSVFRSLNHIYANLIDDDAGRTLLAASSLKLKRSGKISAAQAVGKNIAQLALAQGISKIVFDRGIYKYHGRVKALAEAAREGGLQF